MRSRLASFVPGCSRMHRPGALFVHPRRGARAAALAALMAILPVVPSVVAPAASQTSGAEGAPSTPKKPARVQPLTEPAAPEGGAEAVPPPVASPPSQPTYALKPIASGVGPVIQFATAPLGEARVYVATQDGKVYRLDDVAAGRIEPILDLRGKVSSGGELGLVGFAFHPSFLENQRLFVHYLLVKNAQLLNRISEYRIEGSLSELNNDTEKVVLELGQPNSTHVGGQILFGPDGMLYFGIGDGGGKNDPKGRGQSRGDLFGAVSRIDVNEKPYIAPPNNPLVATGDGLRELWALGLRNPASLSFDRKGRLFAADSGAGSQEVNEIVPAGNYGWSVMDGETCLGMRIECMNQKYKAPLYTYDQPSGAWAVVGPRYTGSVLPSLTDKLIFADKVSGKIWAVDPDQPATPPTLILESGLVITALGSSVSGEIYVADGGKNEILELGTGA